MSVLTSFFFLFLFFFFLRSTFLAALRAILSACSLDALAIALHSLYATNTAMEAIAKAINFLGDADTTGAIAGQVAGAFYGFSQLDASYVRKIDQWSNQEIQLRGILLYNKAYRSS